LFRARENALTLSPRSFARIPRLTLAAVAILGFLLHGTVASALSEGHVLHAVALGIGDTHAEAEGDASECALEQPGASCCGIACLVTLPPPSGQLAAVPSGERLEPAPIHAGGGFDPEGIQRPPKSAA
jgi:hypothetical protein